MTAKRPIVILTGAGISKESGLDTFRCQDGVWSKVRVEDVATPEAFARDPNQVHQFYNRRRAALAKGGALPNEAHRALAMLEAKWPAPVLIVTQNIDNLHEAAGSVNVLHMHGELLKACCSHCGFVFGWEQDLNVAMRCESCHQPGGLRPYVVWFGEMPHFMDEIARALDDCGLFVSIGTSSAVYPAAGFAAEVRHNASAHMVELNLEPSENASLFAEAVYGKASKIVPEFVARLLKQGF